MKKTTRMVAPALLAVALMSAPAARAAEFHGFGPEGRGGEMFPAAALMVKSARSVSPPRNGEKHVFAFANLRRGGGFAGVRGGIVKNAEAADNKLDGAAALSNADAFLRRNVGHAIEFQTDHNFGAQVMDRMDAAIDVPAPRSAFFGVNDPRAGFAVASVLAAAARAQIYKGETAGVGDPVHTMFVAFSNQAGKAGVEIQVNAGQTLTKSMLKGARGEIDFFSSVPSLVNLMAGQRRMYEKVENAGELSKNIRAILGFKAGAYHPVTLAGSGIETWSDIKGRTVFTGPPAGSASATSEALIKIITGYAPGEDYTAVRLSWGEGYAALADGKIDMMVRPAEVGSANIERFGLSGEFRVLSIPEDKVNDAEMRALFVRPGRGMLQFDGGIYKGQLTSGEITALGFTQFVGTHAGVADDVVYNATKSFWENLDEVHAAAFFLREVTRDTAFTSVNVPLHPGALRYYEEAGFTIPDALRP